MIYKKEYLEELKDLGFSEREAKFLIIVGKFSGYFLSKHFNKFAGTSHGKALLKIQEKLNIQGFLKTQTYSENTNLHHLFSKKFYSIIDETDSRFRRKHDVNYIRSKLLTLDFVIENDDNNYLIAEDEKVKYFEELGIEKDKLPQKIYTSPVNNSKTIKYFVDKYPLYLEEKKLFFTYIDIGSFTTFQHFKNHLESYKNIFKTLEEINLIFVSEKDKNIVQGKEIFEEYINNIEEKTTANNIQITPELIEHFEINLDIENKEYMKLQGERMVRQVKYMEIFSNEIYKNLYENWKNNECKFEKKLNKISKKLNFIPYLKSEKLRLFG